MRPIPQVKKYGWVGALWKIWSARWLVILTIMNGAMVGLAAFIDVVPPHWFLMLNIVGPLLILGLRMTKQEELHDD